ncbi:hypothetical protein [Vibrio atypicus]|uniref:hypothetical protein n=1 Tax=Vibrio atypicus TaxID=558271 RepID=UPI003735380F
MGFDTPMAISNYLGGLLALIIFYPFILVTLQIAIYSPIKRARITKRFNIVSFVLASVLLVMHMQTEVIYGKELLDRYYSIHGQPEANGEHLGEEIVTK